METAVYLVDRRFHRAPTAFGVASGSATSSYIWEPESVHRLLIVVGLDSEARDEDVWAAACAGDSEAFALIFGRHKDAVFTLCARRIGSYGPAEDLVATVFLEAWRCRSKVRFVGGSVRPWLFVTAQHVAFNHLRSAKRHGAMTQRLPADLTSDAPADVDVAARLDAQTLAPLLATAISTLSAYEQEVVALCDLAEYGYAEAATALSLPIGTVKSRLSRAHQKLRLRLEPSVIDAIGMETPNSARLEVRQ